VLDFLRKGRRAHGDPGSTGWRAPLATFKTSCGPSRRGGASLKATEQPIDTGTAAGQCFLDMLGVFCRVRNEPASASAS